MQLTLPPHFKQLADGLRGALPCSRDTAVVTAALMLGDDPAAHAQHTHLFKELREMGVQRDAAGRAAAVLVHVSDLDGFKALVEQVKAAGGCSLDGAAEAAAILFSEAAMDEADDANPGPPSANDDEAPGAGGEAAALDEGAGSGAGVID